MATIFRVFLRVYLFYVHIGGFIPGRINFGQLTHDTSRGWLIYSVLYTGSFIVSQFHFYISMSIEYLGVIIFRDLRVITVAVSYCSVLVMTTSILIHHLVNYRRIVALIRRLMQLMHRVRRFQMDQQRMAKQLRLRIYAAFFVKAVNFEVLSFLLFIDQSVATPLSVADFAVKSNLWLINIMTSLYVGVFLVIIYHFNMISWRLSAISEELWRTQSLKKVASTPLRPSVVVLSFRFCDHIDEIAVVHHQWRRLALKVQRLFQPLLLLTFIYHWADFIIQAYLWYITYREHGAFQVLTLLHYLAAIFLDLLDVTFICAVAQQANNAAARTGMALQKFNQYDMDQRLDRTVSSSGSTGRVS